MIPSKNRDRFVRLTVLQRHRRDPFSRAVILVTALLMALYVLHVVLIEIDVQVKPYQLCVNCTRRAAGLDPYG